MTQLNFPPSDFSLYWQHGNGHELLRAAGVKPNPDVFEKFFPLFRQTDELGDAVVRETYLRLPYKEASALINEFCSRPITAEDEVAPPIRQFFEELQTVPDWFQPELANAGARFCMRTGANALIILRDFTLMGGYDFAHLNKPLVVTGVLKKGAIKRLKETLEFWVHVTRNEALQPHSEAYRLLVRTRLMHSYARLRILEKSPDWKEDEWGAPINFWDMIATYTGFSLIFLQGLQKLGIAVSESEENGLFHLWKYVGFMLGIPAEFLPENRYDAVQQFYWWTTLQAKGDTDSRRLAQALLQENLDNTIYPHQFQRKFLLNAHCSMNWFLLDYDVIERLQIPRPPGIFKLFPKTVVRANRLFQKIYLTSPQRYQRLVELGDSQQRKVLHDYIEHAPKDFHY